MVADDALGSNSLTLSGADHALFEIRNGNELYFIGANPDFETKASYAVTVEVDDPTVGGSPDASQTFTLNVNDVNEAPTAVSFANTVTAIDENTDTSGGLKVADIVVTMAFGQQRPEPVRRRPRLVRDPQRQRFYHRVEPGLRGEGELCGHGRGRRSDRRRAAGCEARVHAQRSIDVKGADGGIVRQRGDGDRREHRHQRRHQGRRHRGGRRRSAATARACRAPTTLCSRSATATNLLSGRAPTSRRRRATWSRSRSTIRLSAAARMRARASRSASTT